MLNLTSPLNLRNKVKQPNYKLDPVPFLDILFIAFLLSLVGSHFVFSPGLTIDLPKTSEQNISGLHSSAILTVKEGNMLFYEGNIHSIETLEAAFKDSLNKINDPKPVLLLKMSQNAETHTLFKVCEIAKNVGFYHVQIASNLSKNSTEKNINPLQVK